MTAVRSELLPWLASRLRRAQVLVNVVGFTVEEYADVVSGLDGVPGVAGFELNLSCPNTSAGGIEFGASADCVQRIVALCSGANPPAARREAVAGAARHRRHGASSPGTRGPTGSRWSTPFRDCSTSRAEPSGSGNGNGGVSGPALLAIGVLAAARVVERTGGMPVIGVGGVRSAEDVRQYLKVGAALVAIGTGALADPRLPERIVRDLERSDG